MIIDNILVDWQSSKKVISFPTLVISFVRSYQFSDTCHSNNSSHISDQCGQKKFIYFCWPIIFYSWYIFWYHMGLGTSKNIIIYLWFTLNVMYPNEACYTYQFCEIFSMNMLWISNEQVMNKYWTSNEQVKKKLWLNFKLVINKSWISYQWVMNKSPQLW